jgi:hypothetical protein
MQFIKAFTGILTSRKQIIAIAGLAATIGAVFGLDVDQAVLTQTLENIGTITVSAIGALGALDMVAQYKAPEGKDHKGKDL